jgi:Leucine Rich Repeat (LRR) protein
MPRRVSPRTTLDNLKKEAKRWLKALRANDVEARARFERALPNAPALPALRDVQRALAREHDLPGWTALVQRLGEDVSLRRYERVAEALVTAYRTGEAGAMRIVWDYFGHRRALDGMRRYVRLDLGRSEEPASPEHDDLTLAEARLLVARAQGLESWPALEAFAASVPPGRSIATKAVTAYSVDDSDAKEVASRSHDWDELLAAMRERRLPGLDASGQMTDALLDRVSRLGHITALDLQSSKELTDRGLRHLARLPRLRHLNLMGCAIGDAGLEVLRRLPELRSIVLAWTGVTDAGAAHLAACEHLGRVDLSSTSTGDGAIRALAGKRELRHFRSGDRVTDRGLALLHALPVFKSWQGGDEGLSLMDFEARANSLMLRGTFTDQGLAQLVGLDGLFGLNVGMGSDRRALTGAGLAPLAQLPHLSWLACDATDESMPHIAALPHLRFLMCQDTAAGDDGFAALSRSRSLEYLWGRRCHNLRRRGFMALAGMPALRSLSVSCLNVDDAGLSALPRFPALRELMPMDVPDDGYRHIGRCDRVESLVLMYCRDTTDLATQHIASLPNLKKYFASYNRITDRTPEILSGMVTLEEITFDSCAGLTNAGIAALARLPRLRELRLSGMQDVTSDVAEAFPGVRVSYSP